MLLTSPGVADIYIFLMITWNILPQSYQPGVNLITLAIVKREFQQGENPIFAIFIRVNTAHVDNAILCHHLTLKWGLRSMGLE